MSLVVFCEGSRLQFKRPHYANLPAETLLRLIDDVPEELIGRFDIVQIYRNAPTFAKRELRLSLPKEHKEAAYRSEQDLPWRSPERREAWRKKKGVPRSVCTEPLATVVRKNLREAQMSGSLFISNSALVATANAVCPGIYANVFLVDKAKKHDEMDEFIKRIIVDSRFANSELENNAKMELFTMESLRSRISKIYSKSHTMSALSSDLRHWFHQIPMPALLQIFFKINVNNKHMVFPRCWPMGKHDSPAVAQAATWSILLHNLEGEDNVHVQRRRQLQIDEKALTNGRFDKYLQWLPLEQGGAVFVLIDNMFIIHPSHKVIETWKDRIKRNAEEFHAVLKDERTQQEKDEQPVEQGLNHSGAITVKTLRRESDEVSIVFAGMEISGKGIPAAAEMKQDNQLEVQQQEQKWQNSYRTLASLMGLMLWQYGIKNRSMLDIEEFMDVYEVAWPGNETGASDKTVTVVGRHYAALGV